MIGEQTRDVRILMVDDNPANLSLLADMLISRGYEVIEATDGPSALAAVREKKPDLIVLDIFMPHMDGYEVCSRLKADERTREIPVIFISALSDADNIVRGFEVGGVDYITKPFKFREVLARIANHLTLVRQRKEIEALRQQDRQSFEALNRMKDEFIRMATHDLRNPLNVILGYLTVLDRLEVAGPQLLLRAEIRENIQSNVEKMRALVTDILDLAQVEMGTGLTLQPVAVTSFLQKCLSSFQVIAGQRSIALTFTPPPQDLMVRMDAQYMTRVIDNLVSNAIKYTPTGGQVQISAHQENAHAVLRIRDNGIGIPTEDLPHLFDAFYRVNRAQKDEIEGSGLGLAIVKTIVGQHGGSIVVESEIGKGSTFSVMLPLTSGS